jgi:hypothetical protein
MGEKIKKIISVDLDIESLRKSVTEAGKLIDNMGNNGQPPRGVISSFDKIEKVLNKIQSKTKEGVF